MKIQLMALVTIALCKTRVRIEGLIWVLVISIGFYAVKGGIFTILTAGSYRVLGPPRYIFPWYKPAGPCNADGFSTDGISVHSRKSPTYPSAPVRLDCTDRLRGAWYLFSRSTRRYMRGRRNPTLKSRRKFVFGTLILVVLGSSLAFMPERYFERMSTIQDYEQDRSAMGRIDAWTVAFNVAKEHPLVGGGFQMMSKDLWTKYMPDDRFHDMHSIYFEVMGEQGFVGFVLFLLLMWLAMREGTRIRSLTRSNEQMKWAYDLASLTKVSIVAYAVGGAFLGLAYFDLYYHLITILVLTGMAVDSNEVSGQQNREDADAGARTKSASGSGDLEQDRPPTARQRRRPTDRPPAPRLRR